MDQLNPELRERVGRFRNDVFRSAPGPGALIAGLGNIEAGLVALLRDVGDEKAIGKLLDQGSREVSLGLQRVEPAGGLEHLSALAKRYLDFAQQVLRDFPELRHDG